MFPNPSQLSLSKKVTDFTRSRPERGKHATLNVTQRGFRPKQDFSSHHRECDQSRKQESNNVSVNKVCNSTCMYFDAPPMEFKNQILAYAEYLNAKGCHLACNPGTLLPETSWHSSEFWCGQNRDLEISSLMPSLKSIPERLSSSSSVESTPINQSLPLSSVFLKC